MKRLKMRFAIGNLYPNAFLTLTLKREDEVQIMAAWNRFVTGLRDDGFELRYFWAKEFTRKGKPHLHIMIEGWIPYTQLSSRWKRATGGLSYWTDVRPIYSRTGAVNYVTKYMSKGMLDGLYDKGERRYGGSRGVLAPPVKSDDAWVVAIYCARDLDEQLARMDRAVRQWVKGLGPPPPADQMMLPEGESDASETFTI